MDFETDIFVTPNDETGQKGTVETDVRGGAFRHMTPIFKQQ